LARGEAAGHPADVAAEQAMTLRGLAVGVATIKSRMYACARIRYIATG
jgi:hypothetical protein